jgi:hypothetical protein
MIVFVDLGYQCWLVESRYKTRNFAFFDTIQEMFITAGGIHVWGTWEQFKAALNGTPECLREECYEPIDTYHRLCPKWVFGSVQSNHEGSPASSPFIHPPLPDPHH